jgi:addiction module HigA family antidote
MSETKTRRIPTHPGEILRLDVLPAMNVTQEQFGEMLGLSRQTVNHILAGRSPVSAQTAVKLGTLFGNSPQFWLNMQSAYDLWVAERQMEPQVLKALGVLHHQYAALARR